MVEPRSPSVSTHTRALGVASLLLLGCLALTACGDDETQAATGGGGPAASSAGGDGGAATGPGSATGSGGGSTGEGAGGSGGDGGAAVACTPEAPFDGEPIAADAEAWTWVGVPGAVCRDGSPTGFGVRINPASDKLFIYLEGGGACFSTLTCMVNPSSYGELSFAGFANGAHGGIFDTENADNPLHDWNAVYVPYCTGDVHAGDSEDADVPGIGAPGGQSFVGYRNIGLYLDRIVPTFPSVTKVLLTGSSAGGVGAAYNYDRVAQAFCPRPVALIDDAGPPMADEYLAPCMQKRWRDLWGMDKTLPADCPDCSGPDGGGIVNFVTYVTNKYPNTRLGLLSSDQDEVIRLFYGFGENDCGNLDGVLPSVMSGERFEEGLTDLRDKYLAVSPVWGTYFVPGTAHTFLGGGGYTSTKVDDVPLTEWVSAIVDGGDPGHLGL